MKTLLLVWRILPSELKWIGARRVFHCELRYLARSLLIMLQLTAMILTTLFISLRSMHLFASLNDCVLLQLIGL